MNHFDTIFLICPTFLYNTTYQEWKYKNDEDFIAIPCGQDDVEEYLKKVTWYAQNTNSLIILDDCAAGQSVKNRTSTLVHLGFHARHIGLSTIVITQQLTSIAKPYRDNVQKTVTFYNPSLRDFKALTEDYLAHVDKKEKAKIMQTLRNNKHARLEIMLESPYDHKVVTPTINE